MDILTYQPKEPSPAITWWNELTMKDKLRLADRHFPGQNPYLLTETSIAVIFKKETHG